ncbi:hypothetical protein N7513_004706 [Penicillium frequentans]|nr:hypothetical protein N7513_004706 [Penicillium glabrum]
MVTDHLGCEDLCNFRLSTRHHRDCCLTAFANRFFRRRVHLLSRASLMALLNISRHPVFGPSIQTVVISPDHLIPDHHLDDPHSRPWWASASDRIYVGIPDQSIYRKLLDEQDYVRSIGLDAAFLTEILKNARNCREILLDDRERPWGAVAIEKELRIVPSANTKSQYSKDYFKRAVHVIMGAMTASAAPVTTLAITNGIERLHVQPSMLGFPAPYLDHALWVKTITTLELVLDPGYEVAPTAWSQPLADFLMNFQQLECLDLYFDTRVGLTNFAALSQKLELPHLQTLRVTGVDCLAEDLSRMFIKHQSTLREITLEIVGLSASTGDSWQTLLRVVRDELKLMRLVITECDTDDHPICFIEDGQDGATTIEVIGQEPQLLDRLIKGIQPVPIPYEYRTFVIRSV